MVSSKSLRRFVAGTIAVLFLTCQAVGMAYARTADSQLPAAAQGSCHEPARQDSTTTGSWDCEVNCQSQLNSTCQFANVYAVTDLPAITLRFDPSITVAGTALPAKLPLLRIQSPPLLVLHSRLRN